MLSSVQDIHEPVTQPLSPDNLARLKQDFAEKCFSNAQDLSRMMDQKAGYLLSAVGLLTTALGIVAAKALDVVPASTSTMVIKAAGSAFFLAYVIDAFLVVYNATRVYQALPNTMKRNPEAPGLIFPLVILNSYKTDQRTDEEIYYHKLLEINHIQILHDYANEIVDISLIYQRKQRYVNRGAGLFRWLSMFWIVTLLLYMGTVILR
jgi:hypothetical protein